MKMNLFYDEKGPITLGEIIQVPNHRNLVDKYKIKYHEVQHDDTDRWVFELPK